MNILEAVIDFIYLNLEGLERERVTIKTCYLEDKPLIKEMNKTQTQTKSAQIRGLKYKFLGG